MLDVIGIIAVVMQDTDNHPLAYTMLAGQLPGACTMVVLNITQSAAALHVHLSQRTHVHTNANKWL